MDKEQVTKLLYKYKNEIFKNDFFKEIKNYFDVVEVITDVYFIPELDLEIMINY